eukprot:SAG31_NODE_598_length_13651_cov_10.681818_7_plen_406_part_00
MPAKAGHTKTVPDKSQAQSASRLASTNVAENSRPVEENSSWAELHRSTVAMEAAVQAFSQKEQSVETVVQDTNQYLDRFATSRFTRSEPVLREVGSQVERHGAAHRMRAYAAKKMEQPAEMLIARSGHGWAGTLRSQSLERRVDPQAQRAAAMSAVILVQSKSQIPAPASDSQIGRSAAGARVQRSHSMENFHGVLAFAADRDRSGDKVAAGWRTAVVRRGARGSSVRWLPNASWTDPANKSAAVHGFAVHRPAPSRGNDSSIFVSGAPGEYMSTGSLKKLESSGDPVALCQSFHGSSDATGRTNALGKSDENSLKDVPYVSRGAGTSFGHSRVDVSHSVASVRPPPGSQPIAWSLPANGLSRGAVYSLGRDYLEEQRVVGPARRHVADGRCALTLRNHCKICLL